MLKHIYADVETGERGCISWLCPLKGPTGNDAQPARRTPGPIPAIRFSGKPTRAHRSSRTVAGKIRDAPETSGRVAKYRSAF